MDMTPRPAEPDCTQVAMPWSPPPRVRFKVQIVTASSAFPVKPSNFQRPGGRGRTPGRQIVQVHRGQRAFLWPGPASCRPDAGRRATTVAFIVAFRDGERIDLQEAVKLAEGPLSRAVAETERGVYHRAHDAWQCSCSCSGSTT